MFDGYQPYFEQSCVTPKGAAPGLGWTSRALLAYFQGALLLAKTHNDATINDALAERALNLVTGTRLEST